MNKAQHRKTIVYIIIGIVLVIILGVYVYMSLSMNQTTSQSSVNTGLQLPPGKVMLTPEQSAQKETVIENNASSTPEHLSPSQSAAKAALIKKLQSEQ